jgi:Family of unknown function (DUF6152)
MKRNLAIALIVMACFALAEGSVFAHHGVAGYAAGKEESLRGTVTDFQFINPHAIIYLDVKDEQGKVVNWQGELTSPNHLVRAPVGWTKDTLKLGEQITIVGMVAKNGSPSMRIRKVLLANGEELKQQEDN